MNNADYILLSKKGMKELRKSIDRLERERSSIIAILHDSEKIHSREEQHERVERLAQLDMAESALADAKLTLSRAKLLPSKRARLRVAIGSVVDLINQEGQLFRYTLVDTVEANPSDGRISIKSPLGSLLLGKSAKDTVEWGNGMKRQHFQLVSVS